MLDQLDNKEWIHYWKRKFDLGNYLKIFFENSSGQRLASQMQSQNPDLVEALRRQFQGGGGPHPPQGGGGGGGGAPGSGGGGPNQQPPPGNI